MSKLNFSDKEQTVGANFIAYATSFFSSDNTLSFVVAANTSNNSLAADLNALQTQNTVYRISNFQANPSPLECFPSVYEFKDEIRGTTLYIVANYILVIKIRPALYSSAKGVGVIGVFPELSNDFMPLTNQLSDDYLDVPAYLIIDSNYLLSSNPNEKLDTDYIKLSETDVEALFTSQPVVTGRLTNDDLKTYHHRASALQNWRDLLLLWGETVKNNKKTYQVYNLKDKPLLFYSNVIPKSLLLGLTKVKAFTELINYGKSIGVYDPMEMSDIVPNNTYSTYKISNFSDLSKNQCTVKEFVQCITNVTTSVSNTNFRKRNNILETEEGYKMMADMVFERKYETGITRQEQTHFMIVENGYTYDYTCALTDKTGAPNAVLAIAEVLKDGKFAPVKDGQGNEAWYKPEPTYVDRSVELYPLVFSYFPVRLGRSFDLSCYGKDVECYMNMSKVVTTPTAWPIFQDQIGSWSNNYIVATTGSTVTTNIKSANSPSSRVEARMRKDPVSKGASNNKGSDNGKTPVNKVAPSADKSEKPEAIDISAPLDSSSVKNVEESESDDSQGSSNEKN